MVVKQILKNPSEYHRELRTDVNIVDVKMSQNNWFKTNAYEYSRKYVILKDLKFWLAVKKRFHQRTYTLLNDVKLG